MSRNAEFGESFGMSRQEQDRISGDALGAHVMQGIQGALGSYRSTMESAAYDRMRQSGYDSEAIRMHPEDGPYIEHRSGPYTARWHGGEYADITHRTAPDQTIHVLNVGMEAHPDKGAQIQSDLENWHRNVSEYYR
jgi:hypothetical protein